MNSQVTVSVIIPAYNEEKSLPRVLQSVEEALRKLPAGLAWEVIIVDDGSKDGTAKILAAFRDRFVIIRHSVNRGLSAAMRSAFERVRGEIILIQHADLEYHPKDWNKLLIPLLERRADMVAGSRYLATDNPYFKLSYRLGGKIITMLVNFVFRTHLTDVITAARVFRRELLDRITFKGEAFAFETELTCQAIIQKFRVLEVPITFEPRGFAEGKKIRWHHIFGILKVIFSVRLGLS